VVSKQAAKKDGSAKLGPGCSEGVICLSVNEIQVPGQAWRRRDARLSALVWVKHLRWEKPRFQVGKNFPCYGFVAILLVGLRTLRDSILLKNKALCSEDCRRGCQGFGGKHATGELLAGGG